MSAGASHRRKSGLGRGLDALIPGAEPAGEASFQRESGVEELPVGRIAPNPRQPRTRFDPEEMNELADSIRMHGILQPLIVTPGDEPGRYILIAGERRLQAARQAGLATVPCMVREASDLQRLEMALIENVQRADLGPLEAAEAYRQLAEDFSLSHEQIAAQVGKSRAAVTNTLRLLKLPPSVQQALAASQISEGHARALLALATPQAQAAALQTILKLGLNVRQTEELARRLSGEKPPAVLPAALPAEITALQERLQASLGTRVSLNPRRSRDRLRQGGTLVIHYYSDEELDALVTRLLGDQE
ncbi:MAG: ParB/RepB/Spo0J family partition protein [Anaerolineales bacterium]|nr:ParB/RepB/Spo0J family partition protein [Anaerolineales bacterium]